MNRREPGLEARFILPELNALLKLCSGSQSEAARRMGVSESWVRDHLTGRRKYVSFDIAQRLGEAVRGNRGLDEEWRKEEKAKVVRASQRRREQIARTRHAGRHQVTHSDHVCTHCLGKLDSAHALYMHSRVKHNDRTQGKDRWSRIKRT